MVDAVANCSGSVGTRNYRQALSEVPCKEDDLAAKWLVWLAHQIMQ